MGLVVNIVLSLNEMKRLRLSEWKLIEILEKKKLRSNLIGENINNSKIV
jgi:hypothetical protein